VITHECLTYPAAGHHVGFDEVAVESRHPPKVLNLNNKHLQQ